MIKKEKRRKKLSTGIILIERKCFDWFGRIEVKEFL